MEQFVLGIFQEHLSKFIVGFRKEQVNANLLNGKGEIKDISLNCDFLNQVLKKVTPFVELESVHVSKLSFHVTAWANLKKAPIVIDIEDVTAVIVEPLGFLDRSQRRVAQQISQQELNLLIEQGLHKLRGAYNLFDRIVDNIHVEMQSLRVSFQPRGKFKTRRVGPWTPPKLLVELRHVKYVSVDEYGQEGTPEQVWNHNRTQSGVAAGHQTIMIYKKLTVQCTLGLKDAQSGHELPPIVRDAQMEVHLVFRKRLRDAAILAVQVDVTARKVEVHIPTEAVAMMAHAMAGLQYCLGKDRAFDDPLVLEEPDETEKRGIDKAKDRESDIASDIQVEEEPLDEEGEDESDDEDDDETIPRDVSESISESDNETIEDEIPSKPEPPLKQSSSVSARSQSAYLRRPVIILPNGIVIHRRISFSLSVHQCTVRGIYSEKDDGYVQLVTKGLVTEAMWPKESGEKGGYVQASLSYVSLQERYGHRVRSILLGGVQHNVDKLPIGLPGKPRPEKGADSSFPLFQDRSIRPDPFDLRHTFPEQAFGLKMTVEFIDKVSNPEEEDIMVLHEIGIDQFDVLVDSDAWCRVFRFAMNEGGNGFDDRWHTGDWSEELTADMLPDPSQSLNLVDHLQPTKEIFLDENAMISSDLMNVTARIMNVEIRMPAAIHQDVRSCDIIVTVAETMLVVSSALPRTFLTGKIGASIHGEGANAHGLIRFPNDPSDLCYSLEKTEDPSMRQLGTMAASGVSTARCQLTIRGFSIRIVPVIPFCNATEPQHLVEPTEMTTIVCFEGEPPDSPRSNLIKIVLFVSLQFHRLALNCDLDVIAGALSTVVYHKDVIQTTAKVVEQLQKSSSESNSAAEQQDISRVSQALKNRRVLVKRQIAKSREAGGLSISACMQLAEFSFTFWRQNVPMTSRFRATLSNDVDICIDDTPIALMKLMLFEMKGMEIGSEWYVQQMTNRRVVVKGCLSELKMGICDFQAKRSEEARRNSGVSGDEDAKNLSRTANGSDVHALIELFTFGVHAHEHRSYAEVAWGHNDILLRAEEHLNSTQSMSLACEVGPPGVVYLRVCEIEALVVLVIEALLMPTGLRASQFKSNGRRVDNEIEFPGRAVGALFSWFIRNVGRNRDVNPESTQSRKDQIKEVDHQLYTSVVNLLPERVRAGGRVIVQLTIVDVLVFVPDKPAQPVMGVVGDDAKWLGLVVHQTKVLAGYFAPHSPHSKVDIMSTLASEGVKWESLFHSQDIGIHFLVRARPSLYNGIRKDSMCVTTECLVSEFEVMCSYHPSDVALSMGDTTLSVKDLDDLYHLHSSLLTVKNQGLLAMRKIDGVLAALRGGSRQSEESTATSREADAQAPESCVDASLFTPSETVQSVHGLRKSLDDLRRISEVHSLHLKKVLEHQEKRIGYLQRELFARERDRVAAYALVSAQTTGWLKMGGTHLYGQRISGVTTMWRYYTVLHKSLLILYSSPGQSKPLDVVFLDEAHLLPLAGGRRKRDVKRGFSIVESGGVVRFFMAESGPEYEMWIRSIDMTIRKGLPVDNSVVGEERLEGLGSGAGGVAHGATGSDDENAEADPGNATRQFNPVEDSNYETVPKRAQIRDRLSAVTSTTKSKLGSATASTKIKLGSATASTKSRIGSAVQAARQRGASNDDFNSIHGEDAKESLSEITVLDTEVENESITSSAYAADSVSSEDHNMNAVKGEAETKQPRKMGNRFAAVKAGTKNRFGSALQVAKEKGKAAAEQRRFRLERQRGDQNNSQSNLSSVETLTSFTEVQKNHSSNLSHFRDNTNREEPTTSSSENHEDNHVTDESVVAEERANVNSALSAESDEPHPEASPARRQQLRNKMSSAVQSVRRSRGQENSSAPIDVTSSRFSLRRRLGGSGMEESDNTRFLDSSTATKLRGIHVGRGNPTMALNDIDSHGDDVRLKRVRGYWISSVQVCMVDATPSDVEVTVEEAQPTTMASESSPEVTMIGNTEMPMATDLDPTVENTVHVASTTSTDPQIRSDKNYKIRALHRQYDKNTSPSERSEETEIVRSLSDVLALQTSLSESLSRVFMVASATKCSQGAERGGETEGGALPDEDMTALDCVRFAGRLLSDLIETGSDEFGDKSAFYEYQCELLKEFLNLTIGTPLPEDGVLAISRFLECPDMVIGSSRHRSESPSMDLTGPSISLPMASSQEILACIVACENEIIRLETTLNPFVPHPGPVAGSRGDERRKPIETQDPLPSTTTRPSLFLEPLLPSTITESLHRAMHLALMKIMTERDESHAQLIAASVLHVHEIEQERKRVDRLTQQLEATQALVKAAETVGGGPFFVDKKTAMEQNSASMRGKINEIQQQTIHNTDQEMLNLCQQLASEISAKTSASLEAIRIKESRKIERDNEQAEKVALQNELKRCKEMLASQERLTHDAKQEAVVWKQAYEEAKNGGDTAS